MRRTYKYRIYPKKSQVTLMMQTLNTCCWLYNHFLQEREKEYKTYLELKEKSEAAGTEMEKRKFLTRFDQTNTITHLRKDHRFLTGVYAQVLGNVATRLDLAYQAFFRRVKKGETPGFPKYQAAAKYDSFTYPQSGFWLRKGYIYLSKIGDVCIKLHRATEGTIKTCTIKRTPTGKWFVMLSCDLTIIPNKISTADKSAVGIDMGLESFATLSDGVVIENPRFFKEEQKALVKVQRKLSATKKGSVERIKARKIVARVHERITNKRNTWLHQVTHKLVDGYGAFVVEDLNITSMLSKKKNNKINNAMHRSIADAAWGNFLNLLKNKAEQKGRQYIAVNPAYTSQICSQCGVKQKLTLADRIYKCPKCGLEINRDLNAAINILNRANEKI